MAGVLDFLFGGNDPPGPTNVIQEQQGAPGYFQTYNIGLLNRGNQLASEPYTAYGGQRIAGLTQDQLNAQQSVRGAQGIADPYFSQANALNQKVGQGFNEADFNQYLSPYTTGVVDSIARLGQRNMTENILPQLNSTFTGSGMFGSSRHGDFTARTARDTNESILNQQAQALQNSYNSAMGAYQAGQGQQLQAAGQMQGMGTDALQNALAQAQALSNVGQQNQGQTQQNLDLAYQDFMQQQQYPWEQLYRLSDLLRGTSAAKPTSKTTQVNQIPSAVPNPTSPMSTITGGLNNLFNTGNR